MTISTAIVTEMSVNLGLSQEQVDKAALDFGLNDTTVDYTAAIKSAVNAAAASLLASYLMINSQTAGGFTVAFNTQGIKDRIVYLAANSGGLYIAPKELQLTRRGVRAVRRW